MGKAVEKTVKKVGNVGKDFGKVIGGIPGTLFNDTEETKWKSTGNNSVQQATTQQGQQTLPQPEQPSIGPSRQEPSRSFYGGQPTQAVGVNPNIGNSPYSGTYYMGRVPRLNPEQTPLQAAVNSLRFG